MEDKQTETFKITKVTHPSVILRYEMEERGISDDTMHIMTGKSKAFLRKFFKGRESIDLLMAEQLNEHLKIPAKFWLRLQENWDNADESDRMPVDDDM